MASQIDEDYRWPWEDIQTSPASSQHANANPRSSFEHPAGSWLIPTRSYSSQSEVASPIYPSKARIHRLPLEIQDQIVGLSADNDVRQIWAFFSPSFASLARKHLLEEVTFDYPKKDGDGRRTNSLLFLLNNRPECVQHIKHLSLFDVFIDLPSRISDIRKKHWEDDDDEIEEKIAAATTEFELSPSFMFHDMALGSILSRLTNLKTILVRCSNYKLDLQQFDSIHSNAFHGIFKLRTLNSIRLRGVCNLHIPSINGIYDLNDISLSVFNLLDHPSETSYTRSKISSATTSWCKYPAVCPRVMNLSDFQGDVKQFILSLEKPGTSYLDFSKVIKLNMDLRTFDDVILLGSLLGTCSPTLERLEMTTKHLFRSSNTLPSGVSLSPIKLSSLASLKLLVIRLNFRPTLGVEEIDWFLENLKAFPQDNSLEGIKFTIDMANHFNDHEEDSADLKFYAGWGKMDGVFVGRNLEHLKSFKVIISSMFTDPLNPFYSLTKEISLPRLKDKGIYSTGEKIDFPCGNSNNTHGSFLEYI